MKTQSNYRFLFAALIISCFITNSFAQNTSTSPKNFRLGFKISPNFGWTRILDGQMENNGLSLGFSYGLMGDINLGNNPNYWLSTELIVSSMPAKVKATDTLYNSLVAPGGAAFTNAQFDYRLQYLQLPIAIKMKTNEIGNLTYWLQFGVTPSFMMRNKLTTSAEQDLYKAGTTSHSPNSDGNDDLDFDGRNGEGVFEDNVVPLRMGMLIGAGVEFTISGKTTGIAGLRLDNSFTDLFWDKKVNGRNSYLGVQLGVFF